MIRPQQYLAKLADKIILNEKFVQLKFEWVTPNTAVFLAGQYLSISIGDTANRRSYSVCSSPEETHGFDLMLDLEPNGIGVQYLNNLQFGQEISCLFPLGIFAIPATVVGKPLTLIATGSGIAPFRSIVLDQLQIQKNTQPIQLYWGMRDANQLFWEDEFAELMESFPNFKFHPVISQPTAEWPLCRGHVTDCLFIHPLLPAAEYFVCGSEQMVNDVFKTLLSKEVRQEQLHRENFY